VVMRAGKVRRFGFCLTGGQLLSQMHHVGFYANNVPDGSQAKAKLAGWLAMVIEGLGAGCGDRGPRWPSFRRLSKLHVTGNKSSINDFISTRK
jgi:hypothetical protein